MFSFLEVATQGLKLISKPTSLNLVMFNMNHSSSSLQIILWSHLLWAYCMPGTVGIRTEMNKTVSLEKKKEQKHNSCVEKDTQPAVLEQAMDRANMATESF